MVHFSFIIVASFTQQTGHLMEEESLVNSNTYVNVRIGVCEVKEI